MGEPFDKSIEMRVKQVLDQGKFIHKSKFKNLEISVFQMSQEYFELWFQTDTASYFRMDIVKDNLINPYLKHLKNSTLN